MSLFIGEFIMLESFMKVALSIRVFLESCTITSYMCETYSLSRREQ